MKKKKLSLDQIKVKSFITELHNQKSKFAFGGNDEGGPVSVGDNNCEGGKDEFTDKCKKWTMGSWCIIECLAPQTEGCDVYKDMV